MGAAGLFAGGLWWRSGSGEAAPVPPRAADAPVAAAVPVEAREVAQPMSAEELLRHREERERMMASQGLSPEQLKQRQIEAAKKTEAQTGLQAKVRDKSESQSSRIAAWTQTHRAPYIFPETRESILELFRDAERADDRARIAMTFKGKKDLEYRDALIRALQTDRSEDVRAAAASVLVTWRGDSTAKLVLDYAKANDPSPKVQAMAAWTWHTPESVLPPK